LFISCLIWAKELQDTWSGNTSDLVEQNRQATPPLMPSPAIEAKFANVFLKIKHLIDIRPDDPNVDKIEITNIIEQIEKEAAKDDSANSIKIERWLKTLAEVSSDIFEATINALLTPTDEISMTIMKVAQKVNEEKKQKGSHDRTHLVRQI